MMEENPFDREEPAVREVCRRLRLAQRRWDANDTSGCRREQTRALHLFRALSYEQKQRVPSGLRMWLHERADRFTGPRKPRRPCGRRFTN